MSETPDQPQKWEFEFIPEFADCIARIASCWSRLEYDVNATIWSLAEMRPAIGACITAQILSLHNRLIALIALANLRRVEKDIIARLNRFSDRVREGQQIRNRILHDQWLIDKFNPERMGHLRITADRKLDFVIKTVPLFELKASLDKIVEFQKEFLAIRDEIDAALPSLPEIPQTELHPIIENRPPPQNPASGGR
jgi:hypothetical protein